MSILPAHRFETQRSLSAGFTLIELILVIAIITTLSVLSSVFYSRFLTQNAVYDATNQWVSNLRKAQMYAMMGRQNSAWGVRYSGGVITLFSGSSYATRNTSFDSNFSANSTLSVTGVTEVVFAKTTGLPSTTGNTTIARTNNTDTITINSQGVVSR